MVGFSSETALWASSAAPRVSRGAAASFLAGIHPYFSAEPADTPPPGRTRLEDGLLASARRGFCAVSITRVDLWCCGSPRLRSLAIAPAEPRHLKTIGFRPDGADHAQSTLILAGMVKWRRSHPHAFWWQPTPGRPGQADPQQFPSGTPAIRRGQAYAELPSGCRPFGDIKIWQGCRIRTPGAYRGVITIT